MKNTILIIGLILFYSGILFSQKKAIKTFSGSLAPNNNQAMFNAATDGCGYIQIKVVFDNNCNGKFDDSIDEYSSNTQVNMSGPGSFPSLNTNQYGSIFYTNLNAGQYVATVTANSGWEIDNVSHSINLSHDAVESWTFYLCKACDCFDTSGPPKQNLFIPNDVYPDNGIPFMIIDNDFSPHVQGAYNSNEYLLVIFNRWGGEVHRSTRKDCNGLKNGEIVWDGKDNNGNNLQQDNYNGYLVLQNCDYYCKNDEWSSNFFNGLLNSCPENVRYFNIILVH